MAATTCRRANGQEPQVGQLHQRGQATCSATQTPGSVHSGLSGDHQASLWACGGADRYGLSARQAHHGADLRTQRHTVGPHESLMQENCSSQHNLSLHGCCCGFERSRPHLAPVTVVSCSLLVSFVHLEASKEAILISVLCVLGLQQVGSSRGRQEHTIRPKSMHAITAECMISEAVCCPCAVEHPSQSARVGWCPSCTLLSVVLLSAGGSRTAQPAPRLAPWGRSSVADACSHHQW